MANFRGIGDVAIDVANKQEQEALERARIAEMERANRAQEKLQRQQMADRKNLAREEMGLRNRQLEFQQKNIGQEFALKQKQYEDTMSLENRKLQLSIEQDQRKSRIDDLILKMKGSQYEEYLSAVKRDQEERDLKKRAFTDGFIGLAMSAFLNPLDDNSGLGVAPATALQKFNVENSASDQDPELSSFVIDNNAGQIIWSVRNPQTGQDDVKVEKITDFIKTLQTTFAKRTQQETQRNVISQAGQYDTSTMDLVIELAKNSLNPNSRSYMELNKMLREQSLDNDRKAKEKRLTDKQAFDQKITLHKTKADIRKNMDSVTSPLNKELATLESELKEKKNNAPTKKKLLAAHKAEVKELEGQIETLKALIEEKEAPYRRQIAELELGGEGESVGKSPEKEKIDTRAFYDNEPKKQDAPKQMGRVVRKIEGGYEFYEDGVKKYTASDGEATRKFIKDHGFTEEK